MNKKVCIVNYGVGNLRSVINMLKEIDYDFLISDKIDDIKKSYFVILPGVGSFFSAMNFLKKKNLSKAIFQRYEKGLPILGICLGMHLFFEKSLEGKNIKGMNLMKGRLKKIEKNLLLSRLVPHIGWHFIESFSLMHLEKDKKIKFKNNKYYFLHSYYLNHFEKDICKLLVDYKGIKIPAIVQKGSILGTQFHPEVSGLDGIKFYKSYFDLYK